MGEVVTRFPPEPSGRLHIGHAKAMEIDFGHASWHGGSCILRLDDTNPETATQAMVDAAVADCKWLGHVPHRVTYTSDYFDQLYCYALRLIDQGDAYACELSAADISAHRRSATPSPWRVRGVAESHQVFSNMALGTRPDAVLRLKTPDCDDPVAYRSKMGPHFRTGFTWHIYPTYDMSHCVVDSLEGVTHSFCTREFYIKRTTYFWILRALHLREPHVFEFSRLNIHGAVTSKRQIRQMVQARHVDGWDDPSLHTLCGLRRRGVPAAAIRAFCRGLGITTADSAVPQHQLDHHVVRLLNESAPRAMGVLQPLRVELEGCDATPVPARCFPQLADNYETYTVPLPPTLWIDRRDFREHADRKFFGLAPGRCIRLRYGGVIRYLSHTAEAVRCTVESSTDLKPKGVITWVPELRKFQGKDFTLHGGERIAHLVGQHCVFQIERLGYFRGDGSGVIQVSHLSAT